MNHEPARKPIVKGIARRCPFTLYAIVFSGFVITLYAFQEAGFLGGSPIPKILKPFPVPGILVGYCVAMATGSDILAWTGFALGIILFYGIVGVILDVLLRLSMKRIDGEKSKRGRN